MNIVLFSHPAFMASQSMPRFASMLKEAYEAKGHRVQVWAPQARVYNWVPRGRFSKWAGYVDQYIVFPIFVRLQLRQQPPDTIFVFCDQALGPWVPLVKKRPHVVHAHDLLALRSALGEIPENPTSWSGRLYQRYIRNGFQQAKHFISVSKKTRDDLVQFGGVDPITSAVVYNGLNFPFSPLPLATADQLISSAGLPVHPDGMLLHISGNQWYKNVRGVIALYGAYAATTEAPLPLWLIGVTQTAPVQAAIRDLPSNATVHFFHKLDNKVIQAAYSKARVFLFPSLAEGFGWPIVEAQACGCPVITTDAAPMNEIGGPASSYLPRLPHGADSAAWAKEGAVVLGTLLALTPEARADLSAQCVAWASGFQANVAIDAYLKIYADILKR